MKCFVAILLLLSSNCKALSTTKSVLGCHRTSLTVIRSPTTSFSMSKSDESSQIPSRLVRIVQRFDTLDTAGFKSPDQPPVLLARGGGFKRTVIFLVLAFSYKWYRARFINKIPVWDRQPQWNMVITSKEQEKDLRAYTCKKCQSTLFIAKNREWFFEGDAGLAGLGCYSCGAKGKDNFIMDRDRIVEDVADIDDYFDYERPLDFVSAAERRALLKKAKGNEVLANEMLLAQEKAESGTTKATSVLGTEEIDEKAIDVQEDATVIVETLNEDLSPVVQEDIAPDEINSETLASPKDSPTPRKKKKKKVKPVKDDIDILGLDEL